MALDDIQDGAESPEQFIKEPDDFIFELSDLRQYLTYVDSNMLTKYLEDVNPQTDKMVQALGEACWDAQELTIDDAMPHLDHAALTQKFEEIRHDESASKMYSRIFAMVREQLRKAAA